MFKDRKEAGRQLADELVQLNIHDAVVLALPRGGVPLAKEISSELDAPLGLVFVSKISHPFFPEYGLGAIVDHDKAVYGGDKLSTIDKFWLKKAESNAINRNIARRQLYYSGELSEPDIQGKSAIIVDDGIATGLTMKAAVLATQAKQPSRIIIASPVASAASLNLLRGLADELIVLYDPAHFKGSVGAHYFKFDQFSDEQVRSTLTDTQQNQYVGV